MFKIKPIKIRDRALAKAQNDQSEAILNKKNPMAATMRFCIINPKSELIWKQN